MLVEVIAESLEDVSDICKTSASRIELVSHLEQAGLSPSLSTVVQCLQITTIPIRVMVRPHSHSFQYCQSDMAIIHQQIEQLISVKKTYPKYLEGIVIGFLDENKIDKNRLEAVIKQVTNTGLRVTFHKAVDLTDVFEAVNLLSQYYPTLDTILTQGGKLSLEENLAILCNLKWEGSLLVGGGVKRSNIEKLIRMGLDNVHIGSAARAEGRIDIGEVQKFIEAGDKVLKQILSLSW